MQQIKRIVLIGGPGSGKTSVIDELKKQNYTIHPEVSREIILEAQREGIDQLFLTDPLAFSNKLLAGRINQFQIAEKGLNFYDRGIPDIPAYHRFTGDPIPESYLIASRDYSYDYCFFFPAWESIYTVDNERYEDFDKAAQISQLIANEYLDLGYKVIPMPFVSIEKRITFILKHLI